MKIVLKIKHQRRRSKNERKWPKWLRSSRLLRAVIFVGVSIYRLWRLWNKLTGDSDS